jgi:hypothetical protein
MCSARLQEAQNRLLDCQRKFNELTESHLPTLLKDSANLQVTKILSGDYDLKIARQDYFISKQDQVGFLQCRLLFLSSLINVCQGCGSTSQAEGEV